MPDQRLKHPLRKPAKLLRGQAPVVVVLMVSALMVLVLAVVACRPEPTATPTSTPAPTATAEPTRAPVAKSEPTSVPAPTVYPIAVPTETARPDAIGMRHVDGPWYNKPPTDFYGEPVYGGTLRINYHEPLEHANVWGAASGAADRYRAPTGGALLMDNPYDGGATVVPDLAQGWAFGDALDSLTFHLRDYVTWDNGKPFTCEDARFSFETMVTEEGITASYMKSRLANVVPGEIACLDDLTLEFNLRGATAVPAFFSLANPRALVFNKAWFQEGGEDAMLLDVSVGIGPFMWVEGQSVGVDEQYFRRNHNYFNNELPYVDELVIFGILDESMQQATHLVHLTDWQWVSNWGQYQAYVDHEQIMTVIRPTTSSFRLVFDARYAPFDNVRVRQALVMGINRNAAIHILGHGFGMTGGFGYVPDSPWALPQEQLCSVPGWCVYEDMASVRADARGTWWAKASTLRELTYSSYPPTGMFMNAAYL